MIMKKQQQKDLHVTVLEKCRDHYSFWFDRRSYRIFDRNVWIRKAPGNPILL